MAIATEYLHYKGLSFWESTLLSALPGADLHKVCSAILAYAQERPDESVWLNFEGVIVKIDKDTTVLRLERDFMQGREKLNPPYGKRPKTSPTPR